jgi:hypothetical protein
VLFFLPSFRDELEWIFEDCGIVEDVDPVALNYGPFLDRNIAYRNVLAHFSLQYRRQRTEDPRSFQEDTFQICQFFEISHVYVFIRFNHRVNFFFESFYDGRFLERVEQHGYQKISGCFGTSQHERFELVHDGLIVDFKGLAFFTLALLPVKKKQLNNRLRT